MLKIKTMQYDDIPLAIKLSDQERWGVARNDLERILRLNPRGSFIAHLGNRRIGLTTTVSYGKKLAWIGNVIVDKRYRGKHIGQDLVKHAVNYLQESGIKHVALYSFRETVRFYERLGFVKDASFLRLVRRGRRLPSRRPTDVSSHSSLALKVVLAADKKAFGADRSKLIRRLLSTEGWYVGSSKTQKGEGYRVVKDYGKMSEFGPWVCLNLGRTARTNLFLNALTKRGNKRIEIACLRSNMRALAMLKANGFQVAREGYRMYFHSKARIGIDSANYALGFLDKG